MSAPNTIQTYAFLRLPPEVRNRIYFEVFSGHHIHLGHTRYRRRTLPRVPNRPRGQICSAARDAPQHAYTAPIHAFALLKTCRQIHAETHLLPFQLNVCEIWTADALDIWSETLAKQMCAIQTARIHTVNLTRGSVFGNHMFRMDKLVQLTGLKTVEVVVDARPWDVVGDGLKRARGVTMEEDVEDVEGNEKVLERRIVMGMGRNVEVRFLRR